MLDIQVIREVNFDEGKINALILLLLIIGVCVLNRVGHVGHSRGSNSWVILVGQTRGSNSWVFLVGKTHGPNSLVVLGHSLPLIILVPCGPGYSNIPNMPENFSSILKIGNHY